MIGDTNCKLNIHRSELNFHYGIAEKNILLKLQRVVVYAEITAQHEL